RRVRRGLAVRPRRACPAGCGPGVRRPGRGVAAAGADGRRRARPNRARQRLRERRRLVQRRAPRVRRRLKETFVPLWPSGLLAFWPSGLLAFWPSGLLAFWPFGLLAFWPFGLLAWCMMPPLDRTPA